MLVLCVQLSEPHAAEASIRAQLCVQLCIDPSGKESSLDAPPPLWIEADCRVDCIAETQRSHRAERALQVHQGAPTPVSSDVETAELCSAGAPDASPVADGPVLDSAPARLQGTAASTCTSADVDHHGSDVDVAVPHERACLACTAVRFHRAHAAHSSL